MSCGPWIQLCCPEVAGCEDCHPHLTLTKNQDLVNRATLDVANQVLNLPPDIVARRQGVGLSQFVPPGMFTPIGGMTTVAVDTTGGVMAPPRVADTLVIPRSGCYDLWGSAATQDLDGTEYIQVRLQINGMGTLGMNGTVVGSFNTGPTGVTVGVFPIPSTMRGLDQIAIRAEEVGGPFFSYNYFDNQTAVYCTP